MSMIQRTRRQLGDYTTAFADYATEYWVEGNNRQQWNHFANAETRTNNYQEKCHSKLKKYANHQHPNIFVLIEILQTTQANKPYPDINRRQATTQVKET